MNLKDISLDSLRVFEVAARLENFSAAARELGVTQAAISRRICELEEALRFELFARIRKRVVLTPRGQILLRRVTASLELLSDSITQLRAENENETIVVVAPASITHFWLEPKIREFTRAYPEYSVHLQGTDDLFHTAAAEDSVAVLAADGKHAYWDLIELFGEEIIPVTAPSYLEGLGFSRETQDISPEQISGMDLIGYGRLNALWYTFEDWFDAQGINSNKLWFPVIHTNYVTAINAALRGDGVVLGSRALLSDLLNRGELIEVGDKSILTGMSYFIGTPKSGRMTIGAQRLANWLVTSNTVD